MIVWHTTKRPLAESIVGSCVEANYMTRVAETTALAHGASATETAKKRIAKVIINELLKDYYKNER